MLGVKRQFTSVRNYKGCLCSLCAALHPVQSLCEYKVMRWYMRWRKGCANRAWDDCWRGGKAHVQCAEGWRFARLNAKVSLSVIAKPQTNACVNDPCLWWSVWMGSLTAWTAFSLFSLEDLINSIVSGWISISNKAFQTLPIHHFNFSRDPPGDVSERRGLFQEESLYTREKGFLFPLGTHPLLRNSPIDPCL